MKNTDTEHFIRLIRIAISNHTISRAEKELLFRIGGKSGFSFSEVEALIEETVKLEYIPPDNLSERFDHVYDLIKMTLADGSIDKNEMKMVNGYMEKTGFKESEIPGLLLLLLKGIKENRSREELFAIYQKDRYNENDI
jgi:hypothetical protein